MVGSRTQFIIGITLAGLMGVTRGVHFDLLSHVPNASWAAFFLAGVYLTPSWMFPALLAEAAILDVLAVTWQGVDNFCMSPAYIFLLPAYGVLWSAGRWYRLWHQDKAATLVPAMLSVLLGGVLCELVSSGGFYFFSGRFEHTSLGEFGRRFLEFFPYDLTSFGWYVLVAVFLHFSMYTTMRVQGLETSGTRYSRG